MALVRLSPVVSDARGTAGGIVFTRGRSGAVIRRRVMPTDPAAPRQAQQRAAHSVAVDHWRRILTNAQRIAWNTAASTISLRNRLGDTYTPTGYNVFLRQAGQCDLLEIALPTAPPEPLISPPPFVEFAWDEFFNKHVIQAYPWVNPMAPGYVMYWCSRPLPPSIYHFTGPFLPHMVYPYGVETPLYSLLGEDPVQDADRPCTMCYKFRFYNADWEPSALFRIVLSAPAVP